MAASEVLTALREAYPIPAISAAVMRDGELVWAEAQGFADLELAVPAAPHHLFRIGSVSKPVTAAIGARLVEAGTIELDAPISRYLPGLPAAHRATTLRQLYNHQGGVRHYVREDFDLEAPGGMIDTRHYETTEDVLALFIGDPLVAEPGGAVNYSTFGYTLLGAALESASGTPFVDLIRREVAHPLGLTEFAPDETAPLIPGRVRSYDPPAFYKPIMPNLPDLPLVNALPSNSAYKWAGGGILGSARDVARFGAAHLAPGFLSQASLDILFTPATQASETSPALGLGWRLDRSEALGQRWHHAGAMQGCRAQLSLYPERGIAVAMLSNLGATPPDIIKHAETLVSLFAE